MPNEIQDERLFHIGAGRLIGKTGPGTPVQLPLIREHRLTVSCSPGPSLEFVCLPRDLRELIAGHLFSQGLIRSLSELTSCTFSDDLTLARVQLTGGEPPAPLLPLSAGRTDLAVLPRAAELLLSGFDCYRLTHSTHSCQLWHRDRFIRAFEDPGRHNTVDKAIGCALLQGLEPEQSCLYASCRLTSDLVRKAVRSRIPLLAGKALPTGEAVELARQYGLKLACCPPGEEPVLFD